MRINFNLSGVANFRTERIGEAAMPSARSQCRRNAPCILKM
jgi:hypothetical protein